MARLGRPKKITTKSPNVNSPSRRPSPAHRRTSNRSRSPSKKLLLEESLSTLAPGKRKRSETSSDGEGGCDTGRSKRNKGQTTLTSQSTSASKATRGKSPSVRTRSKSPIKKPSASQPDATASRSRSRSPAKSRQRSPAKKTSNASETIAVNAERTPPVLNSILQRSPSRSPAKNVHWERSLSPAMSSAATNRSSRGRKRVNDSTYHDSGEETDEPLSPVKTKRTKKAGTSPARASTSPARGRSSRARSPMKASVGRPRNASRSPAPAASRRASRSASPVKKRTSLSSEDNKNRGRASRSVSPAKSTGGARSASRIKSVTRARSASPVKKSTASRAASPAKSATTRTQAPDIATNEFAAPQSKGVKERSRPASPAKIKTTSRAISPAKTQHSRSLTPESITRERSVSRGRTVRSKSRSVSPVKRRTTAAQVERPVTPSTEEESHSRRSTSLATGRSRSRSWSPTKARAGSRGRSPAKSTAKQRKALPKKAATKSRATSRSVSPTKRQPAARKTSTNTRSRSVSPAKPAKARSVSPSKRATKESVISPAQEASDGRQRSPVKAKTSEASTRSRNASPSKPRTPSRARTVSSITSAKRTPTSRSSPWSASKPIWSISRRTPQQAAGIADTDAASQQLQAEAEASLSTRKQSPVKNLTYKDAFSDTTRIDLDSLAHQSYIALLGLCSADGHSIPSRINTGKDKRPARARDPKRSVDKISPFEAPFHFTCEVVMSGPMPAKLVGRPLDETDAGVRRMIEAQSGPGRDPDVRIMNRMVALRRQIRVFAQTWFGYEYGPTIPRNASFKKQAATNSASRKGAAGPAKTAKGTKIADTSDVDEAVSGRPRVRDVEFVDWGSMIRRGIAPPQLFMYAGFLAEGGPHGTKGWDEILWRPDYRMGLVCGIIWRVVKEHVLNELMFGASDWQKHKLEDMEEKEKDGDGFTRTAHRAVQIAKWLHYPSHPTNPPNFATTVTRLALQIQTLLRPLNPRHTHHPTDPVFPTPSGSFPVLEHDRPSSVFLSTLHAILTSAAELSLDIRLQSDRIYYYPPVHKAQEFEPEHMTCANLAPTQASCPYPSPSSPSVPTSTNNESDESDGSSSSSSSSEDEADPTAIALAKIVLFPGLTVYRPGGGSLATATMAHEETWRHFRTDYVRQHASSFADHGGRKAALHEQRRMEKVKEQLRRREQRGWEEEDGFRSRVLLKGVVCLGWARNEQLRGIGKTDRPGVHEKGKGKGKGRQDEEGGVSDRDRVELIDLARQVIMDMQEERAEVGKCPMS